ncbi:hypothetical protein THAOC_01520 [Thalassiosira oceanica]|uniref:Uncharacterized protein n=1 Tax=Thalassiosira oceanica TaxID=159749 RepID=K0TH56_THAOC|nr:hypothetical protein THAOC_01520 [Thalassiosira oceanica]|eukprot:EJK76705.1 hypothetical protein THAOC_01520 [Thalassiosira oceanica]
MAQILTDLHSNGNKFDTKTRGLIALAFRCHEQGLFEEEYANIARVSPELPPDLIYRSYAHVGMSLQQKSIADSLKRMFMANEVTCHALALLPEERRAIIFTKCIASMKADEKREKTADNQTKKDEYTQLIELLYEDTDRETSRHDLGVFVKVGRTYCTKCVAGQGDCRHKPERLWYHYHCWTDERLGIDRPPTMDACSWRESGKSLRADVESPLSKQRAVKLENTLDEQVARMERDSKRDCTEGLSGDYEVHLSLRKQQPQHRRFTQARMQKMFHLVRQSNKQKDPDEEVTDE